MLEKITEIVKEAGKIVLSAHNQENTVTAKEGKKNFVTKYDVAVQEILFSELDEGEECYSYFFCNERTFFGKAEFKYHSTTLFKMQYGSVDEMRIYIAIPQIVGFSAKHHYFYYYFIKGSVLHKFHELVCGAGLKYSRAGNRYNPFLVFDSEEDQKSFDKYLKSIPDLEQKVENHEYGNYIFKQKNHPNMRFLAFAIDAYKEWKK